MVSHRFWSRFDHHNERTSTATRMALFQDSKQPKRLCGPKKALERRPKPSRGCTQQHKYKMHLGYQPWKNEGFIRPWKERPCGQNMIEFWNWINHKLRPFKSLRLRSTTENPNSAPKMQSSNWSRNSDHHSGNKHGKASMINMSNSNVEKQVWIFLQPSFEFTRNAAISKQEIAAINPKSMRKFITKNSAQHRNQPGVCNVRREQGQNPWRRQKSKST